MRAPHTFVVPSVLSILLSLALLASGCGGAGTPAPEPAAADEGPRLDGALVWDLPLEEASDDVRFVWASAARLLADRGPESPPELSLDDYAEWMHTNWSPWLEARVSALQELRERFAALAEVGPRERIFAAVVAGYLYDDFAHLIEAMPVPVEVRGEPELTAAFAEQLRAQASPAWRRSRESYRQCVEWAPAAPPTLTGWGEQCARRLTEIPAVEDALPPPQQIAWPIECSTHAEGARPGVPTTRPTGRRPVALLVRETGPLTQGEMDRVVDAVHAYLRRTRRDLRLLPLREIRAARALATSRRVSRRRACVRAPTTTAVLAASHDDLVAGSVRAACYRPRPDGGEAGEAGRVCELTVHLGLGEGGEPLSLGVRVPEASFAVADWLSAVPSLSEEGATAMLLGSLGGAGVQGRAHLSAVAQWGAWGDANPADALGEAEVALGACRDVGDVPPSDLLVVLEVTPDGGVSDVAISVREGAPRRVTCATRIFEDLELPPGEGTRRLTMHVEFVPDGASTLPYRAVEAGLSHAALDAETALRDPFLRSALVACYAGNPDAQRAVSSHRATLSVDGTGAVTSVTLEGVTTPLGADEDLDACLTGALRTARFACTPDGAPAEVEAVVCVGGR